jgi:hypothetical protein
MTAAFMELWNALIAAAAEAEAAMAADDGVEYGIWGLPVVAGGLYEEEYGDVYVPVVAGELYEEEYGEVYVPVVAGEL